MKKLLSVIALALAALTTAANPHPHKMNLTDLANHICQQCGMNDADDVAAAKMFLQRRLEMIWNTQLWRSSLIEATMTVNPDGTCSLSNTVWIPSRGTLLLPPEFESVLAVRTDSHRMSVASLESYYRTDTDWLNMQGHPTEFQVLRPAVWEFNDVTTCALLDSSGADLNLKATVRTVGASGVGMATVSMAMTSPSSDVFTAERIDTIAKPVTQGDVTLAQTDGVRLVPVGATYDNVSEEFDLSSLITPGNTYMIVWGANDTYFNYGTDPNDYTNEILNPGAGKISVVTIPADTTSAAFGIGDSHDTPVTAQLYSGKTLTTVPAACTAALIHQRIRLTTIPQLSTNLRILGKTGCPILGDYDTMPINNVESCLMAFARGDMLLRQRQHGKAQIATQEGATLLSQLARSEAFQTANSFRVVPDGGFGGDNFISHPNSLHPL